METEEIKKGAAFLVHDLKAKKAVEVHESHDEIFCTTAHGLFV